MIQSKFGKPVLIGLIILIVLFLIRQNGSLKGRWSQSDKQRFRRELENINFNERYEKNKNEFIECCLLKCEENYSSLAAVNQDDGLTKITKSCIKEVFKNISIKGSWSESDKKNLQNDLINEKGFILKLGNNKTLFFECFINNLEQKYPSYNEANKDEAGV